MYFEITTFHIEINSNLTISVNCEGNDAFFWQILISVTVILACLPNDFDVLIRVIFGIIRFCKAAFLEHVHTFSSSPCVVLHYDIHHAPLCQLVPRILITSWKIKQEFLVVFRRPVFFFHNFLKQSHQIIEFFLGIFINWIIMFCIRTAFGLQNLSVTFPKLLKYQSFTISRSYDLQEIKQKWATEAEF